MRDLKQNTAYNLAVFMTAAADHVAGLPGLALTITASKDGAAFAAIAPAVTDRGDGWYTLALTAAHTSTLGDLALHVTGADADPTDLAMQIRANILGDTLPAHVASMAAGVITAATFAAGAFDAVWTVGARTLTSFGTLVADTATAVWTASSRTLTSAIVTAGDIAAAVWGFPSRTLTAFGFVIPVPPASIEDILDGEIEPGVTLRQSLRLANTANGGKISGAGSTTIVGRDLADTKDRFVAVVDGVGNRTSIARDLS